MRNRNVNSPSAPHPRSGPSEDPAPPLGLLLSIVDSLDEAVVVLGPEGQPEFVNDAAERRFGIELAGPPIAVWSEKYGLYRPDRKTLWPPEELPGALALRDKRVESEMFVLPPGHSEGYWIRVQARPLRGREKTERKALLTWREISREKSTAESQRRLLAIVENTPDLIALTDPGLRTAFINRAGMELLGIAEQEDVKGYSIFSSEDSEQQELFDSEILPALLRGDAWYGEFCLRHARRREPVRVDLRTFGIFGDYGQILGVAAMGRDLSVRRQAEETSQRLAAIVEFSHDAIISESLDGVITTWNRGAEVIFGYAAEDAIGQPVTMLAWPGFEDDMRELIQRILADEVVEHYETMRRHKDGRRIVVSLTLSPVRDRTGKLIGISKIARDITQQREREEISRRQAQLLDQTREPIVVRDHEDRITYWNKGAERFYGWTASQAKGRVSHELLRTRFPEPLEQIRDRLENEGEWVGELIHTTRSGQAVTVLSHWLRETGVDQFQVLETNTDMSERERRVALEQQSRIERRFRQLLEAAPDAIVEVDERGQIVLANRITEEMFGYQREELVGNSVDILVPDAVRHEHHRHRGHYLEAPRTRPMGSSLDLHARRRDGSLFPVEISLSPIHTESGVHITAVIRDVSERKQAEQEVRRLQSKYTAELESRNREIERSNRLKSEFLASMSHELRTPLHTIIGFAELLEEQSEGPLNEAQERFLGHIHRDSTHLLELINDILDLSKIEAGQLALRKEAFPISRSIDEALNAIRPGAAAKGIAIENRGHVDAEVDADPLRVKEMLYNLLSNAVKFTPEGGKVWIDTAVESGFARVTVGDTGVGIPQEEQEYIFGKFYQVGNTTTGVREGTGLGLSITQELVQLHGGWIEVVSEPGQGSRFTFTLPTFAPEPLI